LTNLKTDFRHIAHELEHEVHTVNKLAENLNTVSKSCQFILGRIEQQGAKLAMLTNFLGLITMVGNLNAQLSAWGRGLEALKESFIPHSSTKENFNKQSTHWKGKPMPLDTNCFMKVETQSSNCWYRTWHREMEKSPSSCTFHWWIRSQWKCSNICTCW
jgi:hypothetical protein